MNHFCHCFIWAVFQSAGNLEGVLREGAVTHNLLWQPTEIDRARAALSLERKAKLSHYSPLLGSL